MVRIRSEGAITVPGASSMTPEQVRAALDAARRRQWPVACSGCGKKYHALEAYPYADEADLWDFLSEGVQHEAGGEVVEERECPCGGTVSAVLSSGAQAPQPVAGKIP